MSLGKEIRPIEEDFVVILGMKGMVRTLVKRGLRTSQVREQIYRAVGAKCDTILIEGETGTGRGDRR